MDEARPWIVAEWCEIVERTSDTVTFVPRWLAVVSG
jgi:hypothetical protein